MAKLRLDWKGSQVVDQVFKNVAAAYTEFGLIVETNAKQELQKGHGVRTGTLRRSIHLAQPGYPWSQDNVEPSTSSPELGRNGVEAQVTFGKVSLLVGSGLEYALSIHQGFGTFGGYHYLTNGLAKAKPELKRILEKHRG